MTPEFPLYGIFIVDTPIKTVTQQIFKNQKIITRLITIIMPKRI